MRKSLIFLVTAFSAALIFLLFFFFHHSWFEAVEDIILCAMVGIVLVFVSVNIILRKEISERDKAGRELKASEIKYRQLHQSMMDAFVSTDLNGRIKEYNESYKKMLGHSDKELLRLTYKDLTPRKWHESENEIVEKQILGRGYSDIYEKEYRRKDGSVFPVELRVVLLKDSAGNPSGMWAIIRDITARKRSEEALKQAEQRFRDVSYSSADWIWEVDSGGRYIYTAGKVKAILGYEPEELLGKSPFDLMPPEEAARAVAVFAELAREKLPIKDLENVNLTKDKKTVVLLTNGVPILGPEGGLIGYRGVDKDISERKRIENELRESRDNFQAISENAPDAIFIQVDSKFAYANKACLVLFGAGSPEQLLGRPVTERFHPDYLSIAKERIRLLNNEIKAVPWIREKYLKMNGEVIDVEVSAIPLVYSGRRGALVFVRDITVPV